MSQAVKSLYGLAVEPEVTPAPANVAADYSSNVALKLAKELHKAPMAIAEEIKAALGEVRVGVSPPGFVNFIASDEYLVTELEEIEQAFGRGADESNISPDEYCAEDKGKNRSRKEACAEDIGNRENISPDEYAGKTVICEFSDPNPFKVLHVGHLYTSVVGNAIANLFEYAGAKVVRANFGGDVGLHVAKTIYALEQRDTEKLEIEDIAECYVAGTAAYEEDPAAKQQIDKLNGEIYAINAENKHDSALAKLYWRGRELSYQYFEDFYKQIGVRFDKYYPESAVAGLGLETVQRELKNGVYQQSEGAVIFDGEKYGLHKRVFINKLGVPTYETKDVGLIFAKWRDYHFDRSVVITGNEQLDYMRVVLKSVEQYAPELVERTVHLTHGLVKLPGNEKMSSRKGNFLKAVDVLALVREALKREYGSSDERVVLAAIKYAFLRYKMGGDIIFDPAESVKMTGNSGPYLLYSCVRAKKILARARETSEYDFSGTASGRPVFTGDRRLSSPAGSGRPGKIYSEVAAISPGSPADVHFRDASSRPSSRGSSLRVLPSSHMSRKCTSDKTSAGGPTSELVLDVRERELIKKVLEYRAMLKEAVAEMAPHKVAGYLYELAQEFSRFYEQCPVAGNDRAELRLRIVRAYLNIMTQGLGLLGIEIPEEM